MKSTAWAPGAPAFHQCWDAPPACVPSVLRCAPQCSRSTAFIGWPWQKREWVPPCVSSVLRCTPCVSSVPRCTLTSATTIGLGCTNILYKHFCHWPLATGHWSLATGHWPLAILLRFISAEMHPLRLISAEMHPYRRHYDRVGLYIVLYILPIGLNGQHFQYFIDSRPGFSAFVAAPWAPCAPWSWCRRLKLAVQNHWKNNKNEVKYGCCFGGLRNQLKLQNAIKTHGISTIAWRKLSVGIKNVEISKDQWHFSNRMFFRSWASNGGPKKWKIEISKMMLFR